MNWSDSCEYAFNNSQTHLDMHISISKVANELDIFNKWVVFQKKKKN